ncbi:sensor histidine kinase N-terminal domain-containing protein [Pseudomonas sp. S75]|uniref:ATP-binding protein n=1 Tax=unclassified Pseudomonas TaxID=196821 RepID=UPI00190638D3|nr:MULTISPECIES: ATP-binding protein [unclassified Pseudomonas]MBJ9977280.1 sensor histidine kinase N-terminal domain-containing protein [Pseudomonas sp. S30]MBK0155479.1 sensor histidine kinase N-terminal domain-containing protein [Pseudomonas sp. S75]
MSLRVRLSLILGSAFILIWILAAAWMLRDLRQQMMFSLDQRLVASARMVAGLVDQLPQPLSGKDREAHFAADQFSVPDGMACQVSSLRGEILASNHKHEGGMDDQRSGFRDQLIDGSAWRTFTYNHGDVRITTADRHQEREALNRSILLVASAPVLMALLGSLGLLWIGLGKGLEPLNRMRDALRRRRADSIEPLQVAGMPSELQPLLETQNQLFLRIAQNLERERRLTDDAAHELRSPLTAIKTHLQVARMTDGDVREQALEHAEQGADRMHRTLEQLLMLARVEGSLSFDDGVQCSAEQVARQAMQDAGVGVDRPVVLRLPQEAARVYLGMPAPLAVAALRNLLDNALRHGGSEAVELDVQMAEGQVGFLVRDHGPGIADEDLQHLTERFWRSSKSLGSGLGLAIVQAIVQRCAGNLSFDSRSDGLRVFLQVPARSTGA